MPPPRPAAPRSGRAGVCPGPGRRRARRGFRRPLAATRSGVSGHPTPPRVVVVGATGTIGTALLRRLSGGPYAGAVTGLSRRPPGATPPGTRWRHADITAATADELAALFDGAEAVVHLACLFQPSHRPRVTWRTNCVGAARVFDAVAAAGVPVLVHASSLVAYSPAPKDQAIDESWPTHAWPTAAYPREKAYAERLLDAFEARNPGVRTVRMRPSVVVSDESPAHQRRMFAGPLLPRVRPPRPLRLVPKLPGLRFQVTHAEDIAEAFALALTRPVSGPFNLAAGPVADPEMLARATGGRAVPLPYRPVRAAVSAAWRLRLVPTSPYMLDAVTTFPVMDTGRAERELGWRPRRPADETAAAFARGLARGAGGDTPPLRGRRPGGRAGEIAAGPGERE